MKQCDVVQDVMRLLELVHVDQSTYTNACHKPVLSIVIRDKLQEGNKNIVILFKFKDNLPVYEIFFFYITLNFQNVWKRKTTQNDI